MKKTIKNLFHYIILLLILFSVTNVVQANDRDILNTRIHLSKNKGSIYQLLQEVSEQCGYLFIYDSQIIDNDKTIKISKHDYALREAIYAITGNEQIKIKIIDNHILLYLSSKPEAVDKQQAITVKEEDSYFTVKGSLKDRITNEPVASGTITVGNTTIGTIANQDGEFKLILPDSLSASYVKFSHLGYESQDILASLLAEQHIVFYLDPKIVPLQEVVVRIVDPLVILQEMLAKREQNYSRIPSQMTVFYREGINHKKRNINITEAVLKFYKSGVQNDAKGDHVKLLKMRRIVDRQEADTLLPKMKSGIESCLLLDLMKSNPPDFLALSEDSPYKYSHTDITTIDNRIVNVISFEPRYEKDILYRGELYIDSENEALLQANFEIDPQYLSRSTNFFIVKKDRKCDIIPQRIAYSVSYKPINGVYYINHIRGDLHFKVKRKKRLSSSNLHMWFEMVNCETDISNVTRFPRNDRISTDDIFADSKFNYDEDFWENFNVITLEEELKESILKMLKNQQ